MGLFKPLEGDVAILSMNGVYKQVPLYTRDGYLYAAASGGFVRLNEDGSTSQPKMRLDHLDITCGLERDQLGRLCLPGQVRNSIPCDERKEQLLLGSANERT